MDACADSNFQGFLPFVRDRSELKRRRHGVPTSRNLSNERITLETESSSTRHVDERYSFINVRGKREITFGSVKSMCREKGAR